MVSKYIFYFWLSSCNRNASVRPVSFDSHLETLSSLKAYHDSENGISITAGLNSNKGHVNLVLCTIMKNNSKHIYRFLSA